MENDSRGADTIGNCSQHDVYQTLIQCQTSFWPVTSDVNSPLASTLSFLDSVLNITSINYPLHSSIMSESPSPLDAPLPSQMKKNNQPPTRARFTDSERHALRAHHNLLTASGVPTPQSHLSTWFSTTFGHGISQSQISKILSSRYAHLDAPPKLPDNCRNRAAAHPELDQVLGEWYAKAKAEGVKVSGDDLREMARRFWLEGRGGEGEMPKFSNGWLEGFKHRHGVERKRYNKDPSKAHLSKNEKEKERLRERQVAMPRVKASEALKALETLDTFFNQRGNVQPMDEETKKYIKSMIRPMRQLARQEDEEMRQMAKNSIELSGLKSMGGSATPQQPHQQQQQEPNQGFGHGMRSGNSNNDAGYVPTSFPLHQQRQLPPAPQPVQRIDPRLESMSVNASPCGQRYETPGGGVASLQSWILQHDSQNQ